MSSQIYLRLVKGSELTFAEVDNNWQQMFYSASLQGSQLNFYTWENNLSQSFNLNTLPGFGGVMIQNDGTLIVPQAATLNFTGSGIANITDTGNNTALIEISGGGGSGGTGIWTLIQGTAPQIYRTTSSLQVTGSIQQISSTTQSGLVTQNPNHDGTGGGVDKYGTMFSQSIWHYTDNIGYPTSAPWQTGLMGSYFNNFDHNTDTAEFLRFLATLLSESAPDVQPNTKYYAAITEDILNSTVGSAPVGYIPQDPTNSNIIYWVSKGFGVIGSTLFNGISPIQVNGNYSIQYDSVALGSTVFSSSNDVELYNLGTIGEVYNVSGTERRWFSNNSSQTTTAQTSSTTIYTATGPGTTADGLTIGNIAATPPVVDTYQDGKFVDVLNTGLYNGGILMTAKESTGYYHISASIGIQSGSSIYTDANANSPYTQVEGIFYYPSNLEPPLNSISYTYKGWEPVHALSRSLSGAPYVQSASYVASASVAGLFDPLYNGVAPGYVHQLFEAANYISLNNGINHPRLASTANGTIDVANTIYDSTNTTVRAVGTVPYVDDSTQVEADVQFDVSGTVVDNLNSAGNISPSTFNMFSVTYNYANGSANSTYTINYHTAGTMGQAQELAYYGPDQLYDGGSETGLIENFGGEKYRVQITNNALAGTYTAADAWDCTYQLNMLGAYDLQCQPNQLVKPGGGKSYFLSTPAGNATDYRYYLRAFKRSSTSAAVSMTVDLGKVLVNWDDTTSNKIACAILYQSSGTGTYVAPRIYDIANLLANVVTTGITNNNTTNPFSQTIDLYGNTGGGLAGTTYTVPLRGADGMQLDNTNQGYIVIIRYNGDPSPTQEVNITIS